MECFPARQAMLPLHELAMGETSIAGTGQQLLPEGNIQPYCTGVRCFLTNSGSNDDTHPIQTTWAANADRQRRQSKKQSIHCRAGDHPIYYHRMENIHPDSHPFMQARECITTNIRSRQTLPSNRGIPSTF